MNRAPSRNNGRMARLLPFLVGSILAVVAAVGCGELDAIRLFLSESSLPPDDPEGLS
jgi:hypothetical protein